MRHASCHTNRKHFAKGLCQECYSAAWYKTKSGRYRGRYEKKKKDYRDSFLRRTYGISSEEYEKILKDQKGRCAICGRFPSRRRLDVDHNHVTGEVRGLLCHRCNRGLGFFPVDRHPDVALSIYQYLYYKDSSYPHAET